MFNIFTACEVSCLRAKAKSPGTSNHLCSCSKCFQFTDVKPRVMNRYLVTISGLFH